MPRAKQPAQPSSNGSSDPLPKWPLIKPKKGLVVESVMDDQIYVIDNLFSKEECRAFVEFGRTLRMEDPKPPGKDEATRTNYRYQIYDTAFATSLWNVLKPHIQSHPTFCEPPPPISLYPKIRMYKYPTSTFFGAHYDVSTVDPLTSLSSKWTLLIYLTGEEPAPGLEAVEGGPTIFWVREPNKKGKNGESLEVKLKVGRAVLHKHGDECMLHEGEVVRRGEKWILRSDVMY